MPLVKISRGFIFQLLTINQAHFCSFGEGFRGDVIPIYLLSIAPVMLIININFACADYAMATYGEYRINSCILRAPLSRAVGEIPRS